MKTVDARGLSCPQPVVLTQKAINDGTDAFEVQVNSVVSKENVLRCLSKNGFRTDVKEEGDDIIITASR
ncbi:MAG: sulfurtransferase TusA family protein [Spirochaetes bacterium]|nr:sulfurtransferase TusA family protein [Spirochaetota bacterium]